MTVPRVRLGVDFGTSNTVAVLDGRPLLFDGAPVLPSAVCVDRSGGLLTGRDAVHAAATTPEGYEPYPKRRIDDGVVLLGHAEVPVTHLVAAVLRRVADEARTVAGDGHLEVTLTYPVAWAAPRQEVLREAARIAGLGAARLVPEPVAAAQHFVTGAGAHLPVGGCAVVYDIGAGTFDVSVVRRTASGIEVVTADGLDDGGGLDLDAAVVDHLGAAYAPGDPDAWARLTAPASPADARAARALWEQVRTGREMLSRASSTYIHLPLLDRDAPLGREQFDALARPVLDRTVDVTVGVLARAGVSTVDDVFLVGGASRSPLVATLLHRALGVAPRVIDQPELAVARGSLVGTAPAPPPASVVAAPRPEAPPVTAPPARGRRGRRWLAVTGALVLLLAAAAALFVPRLLDRGEPGGDTGTGGDTGAGSPSTTSTTPSAGASGPPASQSSSGPADPDASPGQQWADSRQFMEISSGQVRGDTVLLTVRPATKNHLGESWETIPGTGPFVEVAASADGRAIRVPNDPRGPTSTMERLVRDLRERDPDDVEEGFTVTFSALGLVQQVEWEFNPT
ncbi:Hsp70 family protein [Virgisporangium ochraceum]|uniref:Heat shock protein 70 n=1 Tax=Virgisporangium ochraceum TaxID=65505 RepID=A0A8J3ZMW3_9ACTN|nr:Hsp70 family protein [Virgisporangium ochraceum]GIJ66992.1 hypothetical protein Voc01_019090 [Virgisporangium ochraceum]